MRQCFIYRVKGLDVFLQTFFARQLQTRLAYENIPCFIIKNHLLQADEKIALCKVPWKYTMHVHQGHYDERNAL
jgi:hypothetical protein